MLQKKMYSTKDEKGYTLIIEYSLWGMIFYRKEKTVDNFYYSDL